MRAPVCVGVFSPTGAENVILEAKLPPGYYRAKINTQTGNKTEALIQLAKVYRQLFNVEVTQEKREIPVLVLKVDPANAGGIAKKNSNSFISRGHSTNRGRSRITLDGPIEEVQITLQQELHRTVLDETGLKGSYSVKFEFNNHVTADEKVASVRESLAGQGLLLEEVKRTKDCVMVRSAKEKAGPEQAATKPANGKK